MIDTTDLLFFFFFGYIHVMWCFFFALSFIVHTLGCLALFLFFFFFLSGFLFWIGGLLYSCFLWFAISLFFLFFFFFFFFAGRVGWGLVRGGYGVFSNLMLCAN